MKDPAVVLEIRAPRTDEEWRQYYHLRWDVLRRPWGQPEGSEKDLMDAETWHRAAFVDGLVAGVARLQLNSKDEAQIRYMAVADFCRGRGLGRFLVNSLEKVAVAEHAKIIKLDARENAVGFYKALGYTVVGDSYLLFGEIQHYLMQKNLSEEETDE